ncbi:uncharacterized protein F4822DRAFT_170377 [Hypoxylon trugodes]|uniref:uncharacterized protein n=1 Tax=Hypoxylon trugodes TaxID=326681 RepID=UPI00218E1885|nr:uncharacterized protein F4822DRAFT_170377 [Hypoxylon trugodes]KAI1391023.1 hypothetical protein F4822DRAFT_170377 [Hypoxylon trugodes]
MTTPVSGSSLPQTRDVDIHQHNHFHNARDSHSRHHYHNHHHTHQHNHVRSSSQNSNKRGHKRTDSEPTIIVETVSVLQLIDSSGATVTLQTLPPDSPPEPTPATDSISSSPSGFSSDSTTGSVSDFGYPTTSSPATSDDEGSSTSLSSTSIPTIDPTVAPSESSMPTSFPTLSYSPLTSAPLSGSPVFPSLAGVTNTTQASSSSIFPSNSTASSLVSFSAESVGSSSASVLASGSSFLSDSSTSATPTSSSSKSATTTSSSFLGSATATETDGGFGVGGGNAQPSSSNTATTDASTGSSSPSAATVAGSVLGGVAALAFLLILALGLLRWKKRLNAQKLVQSSAGGRDSGGALTGNSGPSGGGGSGAMSETRRSIPFAIPAALASLTGYKRSSARSAVSSDGGERGFSKVSGRKLPPVIQFGGDGYSDPRDTILSDQSIEYRDSQAFPGMMGGALGPTRLAVGTPMRPDSGVPVFNPGPARTPITEQGPFNPFSDENALEPPPRDPLGRSHPSHDGSSRSHGSASRFTEVL